MATVKTVVVTNVLPVNQFVELLGEQAHDISQTADMLVSVERLEGNIADTKAGISSILWGVLVSQGEPVLLGWHDAVRLSWIDAYRSAKGGTLSDDACKMAWSRTMKFLSDDYGYTKPTAVGKDAEAKATKRAQEADLIAAYVSKPVTELKAEAKELFNRAGDGDKEAKKQADLIIKAIDKVNSQASDEMKAKLKSMRADIVALVKEVDDINVLRDVADVLATASHASSSN